MSDHEESLAPGEAGCQLFLISPPGLEQPTDFAGRLDQALAEGGIAGFLLREPARHGAKLARPLQEVCRAHGVAFLVEDDLAIGLELGVDGLHLTATATVTAARTAIGSGRILGAECGTSRHLAMLAGEQGADYVGFGDALRAPGEAVVDLVGWWSGLFVLPSLALGRIEAGNCAPLVRAGADFLGVSGAVWSHPEGAGAGVRALRKATAEA